MAMHLSRIVQFPINISEKNGNTEDSVTSMECMAGETDQYDFVVNDNVKGRLLNSPEAIHRIRITDDMISEFEGAKNNVGDDGIEEDEKVMEKFMCKFASCLVDNVLKQSSDGKSRGCTRKNDFMYDESFRVDKGLRFKISVQVHHVGLGEDKQVSSLVEGGLKGCRSYGADDDSFVEAEKKREELIVLDLPPRLKEASNRNPLHLNADSTRFHSSCCRPPLLCAKSVTNRIVGKPALHNAVRIQKDFMLKLWTSCRHMMVAGKHKFKRPLCLCQGNSDFRTREWLLSLAFKLESRCKKVICASSKSCSPPT